MNDEQIRFIQTENGIERMTEWNTRISYYTEDVINRKKTIKAYAKFYLRFYVKLAVYKLKRNINAKIYSGLNQTAN